MSSMALGSPTSMPASRSTKTAISWYTTNSGASTLIVLDGATLGIITQAVAAPGNSSLTVDPRNGRIYTQDLSLGAMVTIAPPLSLPEVHAAPGAAVTVRGLIARNLGGSASPPAPIKFDLSSVDSPGVSQIVTTTVPALAPMVGRLIEPNLVISPALPPGNYSIAVEIDYSNIIPESNELNNIVQIPIRIRSAAQPDTRRDIVDAHTSEPVGARNGDRNRRGQQRRRRSGTGINHAAQARKC